MMHGPINIRHWPVLDKGIRETGSGEAMIVKAGYLKEVVLVASKTVRL